jgi:predicted nucleic acid-binding protein
MIFADTSAVLKLYVDEPGSAEMRNLNLLVVSALSQVEGTSAIWRKTEIGELDELKAQHLIRRFQADLRSELIDRTNLVAVPVTKELLNSAAALVPIHGLKSLDAIQLASANAAREADPYLDTFACYDKSLARAAASHGFGTHSPS